MTHCDLGNQFVATNTLANFSDEYLVALAKDGSHPAFDELRRRYSG
jgi:hypothetical protein